MTKVHTYFTKSATFTCYFASDSDSHSNFATWFLTSKYSGEPMKIQINKALLLKEVTTLLEVTSGIHIHKWFFNGISSELISQLA